VLRESGIELPKGLDQWGMTIKKRFISSSSSSSSRNSHVSSIRKHSLYGEHYRDDITTKATIITFDDSDESSA